MLVWRIRAIDVTQLALETFVDHVVLLGGSHLARILVIMHIDVREQCWERGAKLETQTTSMTEVVHTLEFVTGVCLVEVHRVIWIVRNCHEGAF